jgi:hypothetical protein
LGTTAAVWREQDETIPAQQHQHHPYLAPGTILAYITKLSSTLL